VLVGVARPTVEIEDRVGFALDQVGNHHLGEGARATVGRVVAKGAGFSGLSRQVLEGQTEGDQAKSEEEGAAIGWRSASIRGGGGR